MNDTLEFDPLAEILEAPDEAISAAKKREIKNILKSYVGLHDSFCELIQNAMDSVEKREATENSDYKKKISINVNLKENSFSVVDNGTGFSQNEFKSFIAPNISFKSRLGTRGNKGVGVTYIAYGFNRIQIATKNNDYNFEGEIKGGRDWVEDLEGIMGRPFVKKTTIDSSEFDKMDQGAFFKIYYGGENTRPKKLSYFQATNANQWLHILLLKTPLGCINLDNESDRKIDFDLIVTDENGEITNLTNQEALYKYPHLLVQSAVNLKEIKETQRKLIEKGEDATKLPARFSKKAGLYNYYESDDLRNIIKNPIHIKLINEHDIKAYGYFCFSTSLWDHINDNLIGLRKGSRILRGGLLIANNHMIQGDYITIPLTSNIGYQNQCHVVIHLNNAEPDLGRKGFQPEIKEMCEDISVAVVNNLKIWKNLLKADTGEKPNFQKELNLHEWIRDQENYEKEHPLTLKNTNFFNPINEISISSIPQSEQDVIVLFNQLIAGGVIRGIKLLATSQYETYDGVFKHYIDKNTNNHFFCETTNPLGVSDLSLASGKMGPPRVLEYKYNLDALFSEFENGEKNERDIHLAIAWEIGSKWEKNHEIISLLDLDNIDHRPFHGITHIICNSNNRFHVIILKELIEYLNDVKGVQQYQKKYYGSMEE